MKELPEYFSEFANDLEIQIIEDNKRWGNTWVERGLVWNGKSQEQRFFEWVIEKYLQYAHNNKPFPWLKIAGEAMVGYIREMYME